MWPFTKTTLAPAAAPAAVDGPWEVKKFDEHGSPLVVRVNMGLKNVFAQLGYSYSVRVTAPFRSPTTNGLPTRMETIELDAMEHLLREQIEGAGAAILALVVTTQGRRVFHFHAAQDEAVKQALPSMQEEIQSHSVHLETRLDKSWEEYRRFIA